MRDLLPVDDAPCSDSNAINNPSEVVGNIADSTGTNSRRSCGAMARDTT